MRFIVANENDAVWGEGVWRGFDGAGFRVLTAIAQRRRRFRVKEGVDALRD